MPTYYPGKVCFICQYVDGHCDLDLWPTDLKIIRDHLLPRDACLCQILQTLVYSVSSYQSDKVWSICQYVESHCDLNLWPVDLKINRDHLHPETHVCAKFDKSWSILCLVIIRTRLGLYVNMLKVTVTLTFDRLTSKSIVIIYTPRRMSVPNLRNLGQFCV